MSLADEAVACIDRNELIDFALTICNIDSAGPSEARVAEYIYEWLRNEGFRAHMATFGTPPPAPNPATCSMWRDVNIFDKLGIPAITHGPRSESYPHKLSISMESLYKAAWFMLGPSSISVIRINLEPSAR